jgi:adenosylhomocysteine nucleosidase
MKRIAIVAAIPGELVPLVRGWRHEARYGIHLWRSNSGEDEWIAACAGMGQTAATRAFAEIEKDGPVASAVSVGWAGALSEEYKPGCAYAVSGVIDVRTGERFQTTSGTAATPALPWLVTSPVVAGFDEKQRLAGAYRAGLVDMEAAAIARLAAMRGIPFACIKGVSDGFGARLPDFNRFFSPSGHFRLARFVLFAILQPWWWPSLVRMGENSSKASQAIRGSLRDYLHRPGAN